MRVLPLSDDDLTQIESGVPILHLQKAPRTDRVSSILDEFSEWNMTPIVLTIEILASESTRNLEHIRYPNPSLNGFPIACWYCTL
jgi:hypothetical protein